MEVEGDVMVVFSFVRMAFVELFSALKIIGKILLFLPLVLFSLLMVPIAFVELFTVDLGVLLILLLSKEDGPKDFLDYLNL